MVGGSSAWYALWPTPAEIERRWIGLAGFDPREVYPDRETNDAAAALETLAARVGLRIGPAGPAWIDPPAGARDRFRAIRPELGDYLDDLRRVDPAVAPLPHTLAAFLEEAEPDLHGLVEVLSGNGTLQWRRRLVHRPDEPVSSWLDHLDLHRLLLSSAADAASRSRTELAHRRLSAAWRLRESLDDDPLLVAQLVGLAELHDELALLRALSSPLPGWRERLSPIPLRQRMMTAIRLETWLLPSALRWYRAEDFFPAVHPERPPMALARFQARRGIAATVADVDHFVDRLENAESTPSDVSDAVVEQIGRPPPWNVMASAGSPSPVSIGEVWLKAARAELNLELTRRAIEVRDQLRAGDAEGLRAMAGEWPSAVAGVRWTCRLDSDLVEIQAIGDVGPLAYERALPLKLRLAR